MPREGFYARTELKLVESPTSRVPKCGECGLYKGCHSPKMFVAGKGRRKIMVVGEAPGATEDETGRPFVGKAGRRLQRELSKLGVDLFRDCWVTNSLICRPPDNATPTPEQINHCRPNVVNAVEKYKPEVIIVLGGPAVDSVMTWLWGKEPGNVTRWAGFKAPVQKINAWVCVTYHPSYVEREESQALDTIFRSHLQSFVKLTRRPWRSAPNYASKVLATVDDGEAYAQIVHLATGDLIAFDFETNMSKPDAPDARIVCCAVTDGKACVAFPWRGRAAHAMTLLLKLRRVGKIAANMKFEHRWVKRLLGFDVENWVWDTMIAAHVLDNRKGVSGLKFQAFAKLGQPDYDDHVKPYLKPRGRKGGYAENRIKLVPLKDLLLYCGLDAILEYKLARVQMKELGHV